MVTFKEFLESRLYRIDQDKIKDFGSNLKSYAFVGSSGSGAYDPNTDEIPDWLKRHVAGGGSYDVKRGLFAEPSLKRAVRYLIPRDVPWINPSDSKGSRKPLLYIDRSHEKAVRSYRPTLSSFDLGSFKGLETGEYFSEKPSDSRGQRFVKNPLGLLQKYYNVIFVPDIHKLADLMKKQGIDANMEGLG